MPPEARRPVEEQLFTDGIGRITVIGGVVRLDLVTYSPNETDPNGRPRQVFTKRVVMGTDAFLRSAEKVLEVVQQIARGPQTAPQTPQAPQPPQPKSEQPAPAPAPAAQPTTKPASPDGPPYTTGPLFPSPPKPSKAPFP